MTKRRNPDSQSNTSSNFTRCPLCAETCRADVKDSRVKVDGRIYRRRVCTACGGGFKTVEILVSDIDMFDLRGPASSAAEAFTNAVQHFNTLNRLIKRRGRAADRV